MKKFYGLRGTQLNIAIAVIAGTDFALFGYGMCFCIVSPCWLDFRLTILQTKVLWAVCSHSSLLLDTFPKLTASTRPQEAPRAMLQQSRPSLVSILHTRCKHLILTSPSRCIHPWLLFRRSRHHLARKHAWTQKDHLHRLCYHGYRRYPPNRILWTCSTYRRTMDYWFWQRHEHQYGSNMAIRNIQAPSQRPNGHD